MCHYRAMLILLEVILFTGFIWVVVAWFKKGEQTKRWELYVIKYAGLLFIAAHLAAAFLYKPHSTAHIFDIGLLLLVLSLVCFSAALNAFDEPPAIAFLDVIVSPLKTTGIYRFIRHPFYASYTLAWLGGTIATGCWWLLISVVVMGYIYWKAAKEEEQQWLSGANAQQYKNYKTRTGMFLPKLNTLFIILLSSFTPDASAIPVHLSATPEEKEKIAKFRYGIYIEEFKKQHVKADHAKKMMQDENDSYTANYYAADKNGNLIGTARAHRGNDGPFLKEDEQLYEIPKFCTGFKVDELAIVNRLAVARAYRKTALTTKFFIATYTGGLEKGTKACFILSEERLLPMYRHFGFRVYGEPVLIGEKKKKRYRMVLCLCDQAFNAGCGSPLAKLLPAHMDDKGETARKIKELGFALN